MHRSEEAAPEKTAPGAPERLKVAVPESGGTRLLPVRGADGTSYSFVLRVYATKEEWSLRNKPLSACVIGQAQLFNEAHDETRACNGGGGAGS